MITLTPAETSGLAVIGENPRMPRSALERLMSAMSPEARAVAEAIVEQADGKAVQPDVADVARAILQWAAENRVEALAG